MKEQNQAQEEEKYWVTIPEKENDDSDEVFGLEGRYYQIRRGEPVLVSKALYDLVNDTLDARKEAKRRQAELIAKGKQPMQTV